MGNGSAHRVKDVAGAALKLDSILKHGGKAGFSSKGNVYPRLTEGEQAGSDLASLGESFALQHRGAAPATGGGATKVIRPGMGDEFGGTRGTGNAFSHAEGRGNDMGLGLAPDRAANRKAEGVLKGRDHGVTYYRGDSGRNGGSSWMQ